MEITEEESEKLKINRNYSVLKIEKRKQCKQRYRDQCDYIKSSNICSHINSNILESWREKPENRGKKQKNNG